MDFSEISAAFEILREEGTLHSLSQLLRKLEENICEPLLDDILWLLEDYSLGDEKAIADIVQNNIISRLVRILEIISVEVRYDKGYHPNQQKEQHLC